MAVALAQHPRLYVSADAFTRLRQQPGLPFLQEAAKKVAADADRFAAKIECGYPRDVHNEHLIRARNAQKRVLTLLTRWKQTGEARFRAAAIAYVEQMGQWEYWSWITWRKGESAVDAIFDLSYGENCTTLAIAYDWLAGTLTPAEKAMFVKVASRGVASAVKNGKPPTWWFGKNDSNWNTVCAGGIGMLALSMYEELPEASDLLARAEESFKPYMHKLDETSGAWPEGIGYWNYGMRYAFMYLLSHEKATGRPHPLMQLDGTRRTLEFPLDLCPNGQPCSFGDVNHWSPMPFHYAAASRLDCAGVMAGLEQAMSGQSPDKSNWPDATEWLLLHPGAAQPAKPAAVNIVKLYKGLDWGVLADRLPQPRLYMSVRGGTTKVPHGHLDLLSFHCVVGDEKLITNANNSEYLDSTFSPRREQLFEMAPPAKCTILINGVGIGSGTALDGTREVSVGGLGGLRLEATSAMSSVCQDRGPEFCGRLVLMIPDKGFLVLDRAALPHTGRMESRVLSFAAVEALPQGAMVRGKAESLRVAYAANVPAVFRTATTAPTTPTSPSATILRWCSEKLHKEMTLATLLTAGDSDAKVELTEDASGITVSLSGDGWNKKITVTKTLEAVK